MKIIAILIVFLFSEKLSAQGSDIFIGEEKFKTVLAQPGLTVYTPYNEDDIGYKLAIKALGSLVTSKQNLLLKSLASDPTFACKQTLEVSILNNLEKLLLEKKKKKYKVGILYALENDKKQFAGILSLFTEKKFKKFVNKANRTFRRTFSGEVSKMRMFDFKKYAKDFVMGELSNELKIMPLKVK